MHCPLVRRQMEEIYRASLVPCFIIYHAWLLWPVIVQWTVLLFRHRNSEHAAENFLSTWPTMMGFAITATAYTFLAFSGSLLQTNVLPIVRAKGAWRRGVLSRRCLWRRYHTSPWFTRRTHGFDWWVGHDLWILIMFNLQPPNQKPPVSILLHFSWNCQIKFPLIFPAIVHPRWVGRF